MAEETQRITDLASAAAQDIPEDEVVSVFYAAGDDGLSTAPAGSIHGRIIELVGARNVVDDAPSEGGRIEVGAEQILVWDPDVVLINPDSLDSTLATDPATSDTIGPLTALQDGSYLVSPQAPYPWVDQPPSVNQLVGALWVAESLYPDHYDIDLPSEVTSFYEVFYQTEISEAEVTELLEGAGGLESATR